MRAGLAAVIGDKQSPSQDVDPLFPGAHQHDLGPFLLTSERGLTTATSAGGFEVPVSFVKGGQANVMFLAQVSI